MDLGPLLFNSVLNLSPWCWILNMWQSFGHHNGRQVFTRHQIPSHSSAICLTSKVWAYPLVACGILTSGALTSLNTKYYNSILLLKLGYQLKKRSRMKCISKCCHLVALTLSLPITEKIYLTIYNIQHTLWYIFKGYMHNYILIWVKIWKIYHLHLTYHDLQQTMYNVYQI